MAAEDLIVERSGRTLVVTINRAEARNAVTHSVAVAIAAAMDELDADRELRVGIITGAGGTFCAGLDLKSFLRGEPRGVERRGFAGLTESPPRKPLIAAVEGYALAGGCEVALTCDLVVAATSADFGLPEVQRGLIAGSGGLLRLPRRIPPGIAMEYALTGELMPATEAHKWGLVNRLTPAGGALAAAHELADRIAANAPLAVRVTKEIVSEAHTWPADVVFERQRVLLERIIASDDAREGAAAFVEKRPPRWSGD